MRYGNHSNPSRSPHKSHLRGSQGIEQVRISTAEEEAMKMDDTGQKEKRSPTTPSSRAVLESSTGV